MEFICGFLFGWSAMGVFILIGLENEWYSSGFGFWVFLTLPVIPLAWLRVHIRDWVCRVLDREEV